MNPPSGRVLMASMAADRQASLPFGFTSLPVERWAKMSPILPTVTTERPALPSVSRMVSDGGGVAKSLRLPVRLKPVSGVPWKGRAITRPILYASQSSLPIWQRS